MSESSDHWSVLFYVDESGQSPVGEFLGQLDVKTQARFAWSMEQLRLRNRLAREPLVKHIEGPIWELRRESATNIYRIFYTILPKNQILFLHGFQKKTQKTPRREIELAERRLANFQSRSSGAVQ